MKTTENTFIAPTLNGNSVGQTFGQGVTTTATALGTNVHGYYQESFQNPVNQLTGTTNYVPFPNTLQATGFQAVTPAFTSLSPLAGGYSPIANGNVLMNAFPVANTGVYQVATALPTTYPAGAYTAAANQVPVSYFNLPGQAETINTVIPSAVSRETNGWTPWVNISENERSFVLEIDVAGISKEDCKVRCEKGILWITGTRKSEAETMVCTRREFNTGTFYRSFVLPEYLDTDKISAKCANGLMTVTLPKKYTSTKRNENEITVA
jgi:HSP20 family protein